MLSLRNACTIEMMVTNSMTDLEEEGLHNENDGDPSEECDLTKPLWVMEDIGVLWAAHRVQQVGHDSAIGSVGVVEQAVGPAKGVDMVLYIQSKEKNALNNVAVPVFGHNINYYCTHACTHSHTHTHTHFFSVTSFCQINLKNFHKILPPSPPPTHFFFFNSCAQLIFFFLKCNLSHQSTWGENKTQWGFHLHHFHTSSPGSVSTNSRHSSSSW